jgi:hypothetical protein
MAELEIVKHIKKLVALMKDGHSSFWHKLKDFALEIFIIVVAVSISIWFHNWSDHLNEQKVTRTFLLGLRDDIRTDVTDAKDVLETYHEFDLLYTWISKLDASRVPDKDSLHLALTNLTTNTYLRPHRSRFDGFLSAGKIMTIEDDSLTQNILTYYQETLPRLKSSEDHWINENDLLNVYLIDNTKDLESDISKFQVLTTPKGRYLAKKLIPWQQLLDRYQAVILQGNTIISAITSNYGDSPTIKK